MASEQTVRAPDCTVDLPDCDGPGTYRCDQFVWGSECRRWQARNGGYSAPDDVEVGEPNPAEQLARAFHEAYEELAPEYGYRTREASAVPWSRAPVRNRRLMIATAQRLIDSGAVS